MNEPTAMTPIAETTSPAWSRRLIAVTALVVLLGVGWRLTRYFLHFPIWGDEAHIALNILDRDYAGLMKPLRFVQAAPLLFLWAERAVFDMFGNSELSLRLLPLLGGLIGLLLFVRLAKTALPPLPAAIAIGFLAVSYYPVRHSCEVKAYGTDLLMSVLLLVLAVQWLAAPRRLFLVLLTLLVPLAIGVSYPALFISATISLVLLPGVWRSDGKTRALYLAYNAVVLGSFLGFYLLVGAGQYQSQGGNNNHFYPECFPPTEPLRLLQWLLSVHVGNMLAYPVGSQAGGSTLTTLFCLAGVIQFVRRRQWSLLTLCLAPFGLTLIASVMHRYPYGGSARFEQHLAPVICLLAGTGIAATIERFARTATARQRSVAFALAVLVAIGVAGVGMDLAHPYKTDGDRQVYRLVKDLDEQARPEDQIVVMAPPENLAPTMEWYLRQLGSRIAWRGQVDWQRLGQHAGRLWSLYSFPDSRRFARLMGELPQKAGCPLVLLHHGEYWFQAGWSWDVSTRRYCELFEWDGVAE